MKNLIKLPILGIEFNSEEYIFIDNGFVKDVNSQGMKNYEKFGDNPENYVRDNTLGDGKLPEAYGLTQVPPNQLSPIKVIICYQNRESLLEETFIRGHEETHALEKMREIHLIERKLSNIGININLFLEKDCELIADFGGLYAVISYGFESEEILSFLSGYGERGKILSKIYINYLDSCKNTEVHL